MPGSARTVLPDLPKGHRFSELSFQARAGEVAQYLEAVKDANEIYLERGLAPPLAVAARALGKLLELIELPAGTLHTGQEVEAHAKVPLDATLTLRGSIAQRSERAGLIISVIEFAVTPAGSANAAVTGRTTVMVPATASVAWERA